MVHYHQFVCLPLSVFWPGVAVGQPHPPGSLPPVRLFATECVLARGGSGSATSPWFTTTSTSVSAPHHECFLPWVVSASSQHRSSWFPQWRSSQPRRSPRLGLFRKPWEGEPQPSCSGFAGAGPVPSVMPSPPAQPGVDWSRWAGKGLAGQQQSSQQQSEERVRSDRKGGEEFRLNFSYGHRSWLWAQGIRSGARRPVSSGLVPSSYGSRVRQTRQLQQQPLKSCQAGVILLGEHSS